MPHNDTVFLKCRVPLFSVLRPEHVRGITSDVLRRTFGKDQTVLFRGEIPRALYVVRRGRVRSRLRRDREREGRLLGAGDVFGAGPLLYDVPSAEWVQAAEEGTEILAVPHDSLERLVRAYPEFRRALAERAGEPAAVPGGP